MQGPTYEPVEMLGSGANGQVVKARNVATGEFVAIKMLERGGRIDAEFKYVEREMCIHKRLAHNHIVRFREAFLTASHLCIVMEFVAGGSLLNYLNTYHTIKGHGPSEERVRWFFWQLVVAVDYCHRRDVCNRDLKLDNVLVTEVTEKPLLKICDFGYSKNHAMGHSVAKTRAGSPAYMAPEVIMSGRTGAHYDGKAADIWSCGVMLYAMLFWSFPFGIKNTRRVLEKILSVQPIIPETIPDSPVSSLHSPLSPACRDLLQRMICKDPTQRITVQEIYSHPWFLEGCPVEVVNYNDTVHRHPDPNLQSDTELTQLAQAACLTS